MVLGNGGSGREHKKGLLNKGILRTQLGKRSLLVFLLKRKRVRNPDEEQKYRDLFDRKLDKYLNSFKKSIQLI